MFLSLALQNTPNLRMFLMVFLAVFVALPLGLMRNIESLTNISAVSLGFYSVFIAEVSVAEIISSSESLLYGDDDTLAALNYTKFNKKKQTKKTQQQQQQQQQQQNVR